MNAEIFIIMNRCLIGIVIDAVHIRVACIKESKIEHLISEEIKNKKNEQVLLNQIAALIEQLLQPQVKGIGLGVPSVVNTQQGIGYDVQNIPLWERVPVKSIFEERFQLPVFINNNINCFVLGEKYFGKGKNCNSIAGLLIRDSGLGVGLIINGMLYEGPNCGAGKVGMLPYRESVLEHYCSGQFFRSREGITGLEAYRLAAAGNFKVKTLFEEFGIHFGIAVEAVIYAFDPEMIIIGGTMSKTFRFFRDAMYSSLESFAYQNSLKNITISPSEEEQITLKGAAALVLENQ